MVKNNLEETACEIIVEVLLKKQAHYSELDCTDVINTLTTIDNVHV